MPTPPVVLTIAGFDPSSGAGVTADIKTIAAHGCYGVACITALTVQSTAGVWRIDPVSPKLVTETLEELAQDVEIASVHVGMLGSKAVVEAVSSFLATQKLPNIVVDPVIRSSSGAELLSEAGIRGLVKNLLPLATVVTPNIDEAALLTGLNVSNLDQMREAATKFHELNASGVVITGGHLEEAVDLLSLAGNEEVFRAPKQKSKSTHGTGCAFATSIACHLALGKDLTESVRLAKSYVTAAIRNAFPLGRGTGPVNHLYGMATFETTIPDVGKEKK
ncbi:MAG TPA: bifunctional hydroxymethylpyrimidine kinase/phosphomethylpyrimidine kinase [Terriglobales bacterium]|nr:bifunctional hydroxymethylpyrimidine kinase/phosphomethylpyrimidine kinase [Terriglobales bacterium]